MGYLQPVGSKEVKRMEREATRVKGELDRGDIELEGDRESETNRERQTELERGKERKRCLELE